MIRPLLVLVQVVGALAIAAYPGVLVASVSTLAARGGGPAALLWKLVALVSLAYPLLWVVLFLASWLALRHGHPLVAFAFSAPPFLVSVFLAVQLAVGVRQARAITRGYADAQTKEAERVGRDNPVAGSLLLFERGALTPQELQDAIRDADARLLSVPVERRVVEVPGMVHRTFPEGAAPPVRRSSPLAIALSGSTLARSLETREADPFLDAARALMERGATLSPEEQASEAKLVWLAEVASRRVVLPDPAAQTENPLVWTIVRTAEADQPPIAAAIYAAAHRTPELLRKPTTTYGTPLRAALLRNMSDRVRDLIRNGAVLSGSEQRVPSLVRQLEGFLDLPINEGMRAVYQTNAARRS